MIIFVMSDIHGAIKIFKETFDTLIKDNLKNNRENKLILLGDYLDRKNRDTKILYYLKDLQEQFKNQIIMLMGNHEFMFLEDIQTGPICFDDNDIIDWLKSLPFYYETDTQIFVHAGIDEEAGEYWKWGTEDYFYCSKYPYTLGKFQKDIIAGHIFTSEIMRDESYHKVYWDRKSHFYIDGQSEKSKFIPVLKYNTITKRYSSFEKISKEDNTFLWSEYTIK
ncbi:calcineurin-like phosphoesterase family protein [Clostridium sporogenes]|uniref:Calcineurin-like phosphoesterase family protein n=1 Tax=Clostridium sporogenes TaxID=1509 RepID=A0A1L3NHI9_CLOSG|nr:metallophosphoesterase [Clostridium sporogenes]APH15609.1 calcineurin-like phosphoesterase family protein [Clostridium sporogenes]